MKMQPICMCVCTPVYIGIVTVISSLATKQTHYCSKQWTGTAQSIGVYIHVHDPVFVCVTNQAVCLCDK